MAELNDDFLDMIHSLLDHEVEFMVIGAYALSMHGHVRATEDIDFWVRPSAANAQRIVAALNDFGAPLTSHGISTADFEVSDTVYQMGLPPRRIDLLTSVSGVSFDAAFASSVEGELGGYRVRFMGRQSLLANKRATGRAKDLADVDALEALGKRF